MLHDTQASSSTAPVHVGNGNSSMTSGGPEDDANFLSRYTFWWVYDRICSANARGKLLVLDLPHLPRSDDPGSLFDRAAAYWSDQKGENPRITWTLFFRTQYWRFMTSLLHGWMFLFLMFIDPILLGALLNSAQAGGTSDGPVEAGRELWRDMFLVLGLSLSMLVRVSCMELCYFHSARLTNNVRSTVVHAIYRKAMLVPDHLVNVGLITNLMATDADKLANFGVLFTLSQCSWAVLSLPMVLYFLYRLVGIAAFVTTVFVGISVMTTRALSKRMARRTRRLQECRDRRSKMMNELIKGIRTVKLQTLEALWMERISKAREDEMHALVAFRVFSTLVSLVGAMTSIAVPVIIFGSVTLLEGRTLDAATAFTSLAWISTLRWSLDNLPGLYNLYADLQPSVDRISAFLTLPIDAVAEDEPMRSASAGGSGAAATLLASQRPSVELNSFHSGMLRRASEADPGAWRLQKWLQPSSAKAHDKIESCKALGVPIIELQAASLGYLADMSDYAVASRDIQASTDRSVEVNPSSTCVLRDLNMQVVTGELVVIAGPVGSGKSTLLASLAGARSALSGSIQVRGSRSYVSQKPFLLNATVQENILFGLPLDPGGYKDAISRTALEEDLRALSLGDQTLVGENGVQLSGGQKARVGLARALYANADVAFLDDILSAVDAHTGRHLWDHSIVNGLLQRGKTVLLVSHQLQYLSRPEVNRVILLRSGQIWLQGPWSSLVDANDELLRFVNEWDTKEEEDSTEATEVKASEESTSSSHHSVRSATGSQHETAALSLHECQDEISKVLLALSGRRINRHLIDGVVSALAGDSETTEVIQAGGITWLDFKAYLGVFGSRVTVTLLVGVWVSSAVLDIMSNVWLSIWTGGQSKSSSSEQSNLAIYASIGAVSTLMGSSQALVLLLCSLTASRLIHRLMLKKLMGSPMSFFDSSPTGRIMNRFLQDLQNVDTQVPDKIARQVISTLNVITELSLIYVVAPWVLAALPFLVVPYVLIFQRMRVPNRDTRRIESAARSPVYAHFNDILLGRETVRAFAAEARFEAENLRQIESMATAAYGNQAICKWAQILTVQWGVALYLVCGLVCAAMLHFGQISTSQVGLVLLYAGSLQRDAMDYMMNSAELEKQFVSVERVAEYTRLETEDQQFGGRVDVAQPEVSVELFDNGAPATFGWPAEPGISLTGVALRYRLHRPLVLAGVDLKIQAKAKVAICGRTGCGKSTLFAALCRLYPLVGGRIVIGGQDIDNISLRTLREQIRVVSQDSFLISGTLRHNLVMQRDSRVPDAVLWHCLKEVGMSEKVLSLQGGLDVLVEEGGQNFSVGERQLLALARVLVPRECISLENWRPPWILLCDEATASVDLVADERVHDLLLSLDATVLMICHRLQHIHRFQQVVVMDAGRVAEFGSPGELLSQGPSGSRLAHLCMEAGVL